MRNPLKACDTKHWYFAFQCSRRRGHRNEHSHAGCSWSSHVDVETESARREYIARFGSPS